MGGERFAPEGKQEANEKVGSFKFRPGTQRQNKAADIFNSIFPDPCMLWMGASPALKVLWCTGMPMAQDPGGFC